MQPPSLDHVYHKIAILLFSLIDQAQREHEALANENKRLIEELKRSFAERKADVMSHHSEMMAMETRYQNEIKMAEERHQKEIQEMAHQNESVTAYTDKMYEKCQSIVKEMQAYHEEKQESIVEEMRSQFQDKNELHQRIVTGMRREYLKVMEDTSEQRQDMIKDLQKRNRQNEKERGDVVDDLQRKHDAELREASRELKRQTMGDCRKDVEHMKNLIATERLKRLRARELHAAELARLGSKNGDGFSPRPMTSSRSEEDATHVNVKDKAENLEKCHRPPFGDVATLRAWLASHRPPAQGPVKAFRPVSDFVKQPTAPPSGRMSPPSLHV